MASSLCKVYHRATWTAEVVRTSNDLVPPYLSLLSSSKDVSRVHDKTHVNAKSSLAISQWSILAARCTLSRASRILQRLQFMLTDQGAKSAYLAWHVLMYHTTHKFMASVSIAPGLPRHIDYKRRIPCDRPIWQAGCFTAKVDILLSTDGLSHVWSSSFKIGVIGDPGLMGDRGWLTRPVISTSSPTRSTAPLGPAQAY